MPYRIITYHNHDDLDKTVLCGSRLVVHMMRTCESRCRLMDRRSFAVTRNFCS